MNYDCMFCSLRNIPTFEEASVKLFNVVDLPLEGCETFLSTSATIVGDKTNLSDQPNQWITSHDGSKLQIGDIARPNAEWGQLFWNTEQNPSRRKDDFLPRRRGGR